MRQIQSVTPLMHRDCRNINCIELQFRFLFNNIMNTQPVTSGNIARQECNNNDELLLLFH